MKWNRSFTNLHLCRVLSLFLLLLAPSLGLNLDGTLLLTFKYSILSDPLSVLHNWDYNDATPCLWTGVACAEVVNAFGVPEVYRVISLSLPNSNLLGVIPQELGFIPHLRILDLSSNLLNGTLPSSLFTASELEILSLSNNVISGVIPEFRSKSLKLVNLSDNALSDRIPKSITSLQNLTIVSFKGNYLSGPVPSGVESLEVLDLSSNLLNGSLPPEFGGEKLWYLNLSSNNLSGSLPPQFAAKFPQNATIDLSFNDLSGEISASTVLSSQKVKCYEGNTGLCGQPLKKLCSIPSILSMPPNNSSANTSSPAIAAIPRQTGSSPKPASSAAQVPPQHSLKPVAIAGIAVVPLAGAAILAAIYLFIYQKQKKANSETKLGSNSTTINACEFKNKSEAPSTVKEKRSLRAWPCLSMTSGEETSEATGTDSDDNTDPQSEHHNQMHQLIKGEKSLVMVDGETQMEPETLLKASACVLGSCGSTIVYKAVIEDGTAFAVRRIGQSSVQKLSEFENHVKAIAKLKHQNIVRVRGFYWGDHEKLVIYDYVSNGSMANVGHRKIGSSPNQLTFNTRLKIAKGVARGLNFIHEKKHVHGSIKPSNILLTPQMEPLISDLGLHWLIHGRRSDTSAGHIEVNGRCTSPYCTPESLGCSRKPNPKWDVYSFGILLLDLLMGRGLSDRELSQWTGREEPNRVLRVADVGARGDVAGREEATLAWFKLGLRCVSSAPQKRPSMKCVVGMLEKIPLV